MAKPGAQQTAPAATAGTAPSTGAKTAGFAGQMLQGVGQDQASQQEAILNSLARIGPPPTMNTAGAPIAGQDIVGKYKGSMRPPNVNYRTRQDAQLNPSVGQMLTGGGY